jgi:hypothetical protein
VGAEVPLAGPVRLESNDFNDRPSKDFQPDTVITVGPPRKALHGIIIEIQQEDRPPSAVSYPGMRPHSGYHCAVR